MIVPKSNRTEVYKYLFREGVIYAKKDPNLPKHPEIDVPNLQVIKLLQSLTSRELVKEQYAWQHYYWYLKDEGIEYLREYLNLPEEIVPATLKKSTALSSADRRDREDVDRRADAGEASDATATVAEVTVVRRVADSAVARRRADAGEASD
eukprot:CAMPEP_0119188496 /NCGR_PEP_ID=MMETSP1316-20130426/64_1 /TAXON_ID=41880 /ORGANISM="Pycnococcus provasolii, Strain RCC2336" /LENGTH=150 /DNA_ID=CAMNT_0007182955 /DNA_START=95 /DNA_END=545 /DNA_ORIENTATION=+